MHIKIDDIWYTTCKICQVVFVFPTWDNNFTYKKLISTSIVVSDLPWEYVPRPLVDA